MMTRYLEIGFKKHLIIIFILIYIACLQDVKERLDFTSPGDLLILISLDAFRYDFLFRKESSTLLRLGQHNGHIARLIPQFPSYTFPNHYTMMTGKVPINHGIIGNVFYDDEMQAAFNFKKDSSGEGEQRWWRSEPLYITANKDRGMKTCSLSWPGNQVYKHELCIAKPYQSTDSSLDVINSALEIIDSERDLRFMNIYLSAVDRAGHSNGPVGSKTNQAIKEVDAALKRLLKELYNRSLLHKTNIVVVSDHGMTKRRHDCQINLYKIIPALRDLVVWMDDDRPVTSVHVKKGSESKVYDLISEAIVEKKLKLDIYWTSELPRRLRIKKTPRSGQIWLMCREGCTFVREESLKKNDKGTHGYDPDMKSMHGIFVASGPAFRGSVDLASIPLQEDFENETIIGDKIEPKEMEGSGFSGVLKNLNKNFVKIRPKHVKLDRRLQIKKHHRKKLTEAELTLAIKQMNSLLMSSSEKADYEGQNFIKKNSKNVIETPLRGQRISNIEIYPLLCRVLGIHCLPGDYSRFEDSLISQILT